MSNVLCFLLVSTRAVAICISKPKSRHSELFFFKAAFTLTNALITASLPEGSARRCERARALLKAADAAAAATSFDTGKAER